jgi:pimeloyl-ACP methyl ester carboxylesterase
MDALPHVRQVEGTEVLVEGDGPHTLVLIHGWPDTQVLWDPLVAHLLARPAPAEQGLRCVRFTLPGNDLAQGRRPLSLAQMTAHFAAIVDAVSPDRPVTLLLHDWGAVYGYQYAMQHPGRVARIVGVDIGDTASGEFLRSLPFKAKLGIVGYQAWLALAYGLPVKVGDRMTRWMARQLRAPAPAASIAAQMNHPYVATWSGGFRHAVRVQPTCPVLFIYGQRKPFMFHAPQWAERIAATPGGAVHGLRAGHWVMVNQPEAFHQIVSTWLAATVLHTSAPTPPQNSRRLTR